MNNNYPRKITLENEKLKKYLTEKSELITIGRGLSDEIETMEKEMTDIDVKIQEEEAKVDISDILKKEKVITAKVEEAIKEMNGLKEDIYARMKSQVPNELHEQYDNLKIKKENAETERNKTALKAQKYTDKIIPLGRKLMKPYLENQYEDYETITLENGEVVATIFNHLNEFEINFAKKLNK